MDIIGKASESIHRRNADKAYEAEDYDTALREYLKVIELGLKHGEYAELAHFYERAGKSYLNKEFNLKDERTKNLLNAADHLVKAARMYREKGQWFEAGGSFETAAKTYEELKEIQKAAENRLRSAKMYTRAENDLITGLAYFHAAEYFEQLEDWENAGKAFYEAAKMNVLIKDYATASSAYKKAANAFRRVGKVEDAIDAYAVATELDFELGNYSDVAATYEHIALCYEDLKNYNSALHYHLKAAEAFMDGKDYQATSKAYNNIGHCYAHLGDQKNAIDYFMRAVKLNADKKDQKGLSRAYENAANAYERFGAHEEAAESFLEAARALIAAENKASAASDYRRAADIYLKLGDVAAKRDGETAAEFYHKASDCFSELKDYKNAADVAFRGAKLRMEGDNYDIAIAELRAAADLYLKQGDPMNAAKCYNEAKDYLKAADTYAEFAEQQLKEKNFLAAADAYKLVAESYGRLKKFGPMREYYNNAIWQYTKYAKTKEQYELANDAEVREVADAYLNVAECNRLVGDDANAKANYKKAIDYYQRLTLDDKRDYAKSFLLLVEAKLAIKKGDYEGASEMLEEGLSLIDRMTPTMADEEREQLEQAKKDAESLIADIGEKPELDLVVDRHSVTFTDATLVLNGTLTDNGKNPLYRINFLAHVPDELAVESLPDPIAQLDAGAGRKVTLELRGNETGEYRIKPLEVFYEDSDGNKYVKASNEVYVSVLARPDVDFNTYRKAMETYNHYAESQLANGNFYYAADGFRWAAAAYGTFNDDEHLRQLYDRAIETYQRFIDDLKEQEEQTHAQQRQLAQAQHSMGVCHAAVDRLSAARESFEAARDGYRRFIDGLDDHQEKRALEKHIDVVEGHLAFIDGKLAVSHGSYDEAEDLLEKAHAAFERAITKGGWEADVEHEMEKRQEEIRRLLEDIKAKPSFAAEMPETLSVQAGVAHPFTFFVENQGDDPLYDVAFLLHFPEEVAVMVPPEKIAELAAGERRKITVSVKAQAAGEYSFEPMNVTYKDADGHKYLRGTQKVTLTVVQAGKKVAPEAGAPAGDGGGLSVSIDAPDKVSEGEDFSVRVKVENTSSYRVLHDVVIDFTGAEDGVHSQPPLQKLDKILPGKRVTESFKLRAKKQGKQTIPVAVSWEGRTTHESFSVKVIGGD